MDTTQSATRRSYEEFQPSFMWNREEESDTLVISVPGFKKEHLKVLLDTNGKLRVSGECPLQADDRWSRFHKEFYIPQNANTSAIHAKFENGNLSVIIPKLITKFQQQEPELSQKPTIEPKPTEDKMVKENWPNGDSKGKDEADKATKNAPNTQEKKKGQIDKSEDKKPARDTGDNDAELPNSRKRKNVAEDEAFHGTGNKMETKGSQLATMFKKPRKLLLNVCVAVVILVGLAFYVSCKLKKSINGDTY